MTHEPPFTSDDSIPEVSEFSSFERENKEVNDDSDAQSVHSEFEEINVELNLSLDPNYPPMTKWTRDHPKTQVIGESSSGVLTRAQQKAKQSALLSKVEYCMINSFISKVEPKNVQIALDRSD